MLSAGCAVCRSSTEGRNADDSKDMCLCMDGMDRLSGDEELSEMMVLLLFDKTSPLFKLIGLFVIFTMNIHSNK